MRPARIDWDQKGDEFEPQMRVDEDENLEAGN